MFPNQFSISVEYKPNVHGKDLGFLNILHKISLERELLKQNK